MCALLGAFSATFYNCKSSVKDTDTSTTPNAIFSFTASPYLPDDVEENASDTALAAFAWQEFLALNWKSSYGTDSLKAEPDTSWSFTNVNDPNPEIVVWETYAHRSELSPYYYPMRPFDSLCKYSYQYAPTPGTPMSSYALLHNLDETSEIGSCNLAAFANTTNQYTDSQMVRYQAKVNRIEYDYIRNTFPTYDSLKTAVARTKAYYDVKFDGRDTVIDSNSLLNLPFGSVEVKTAWRLLGPQDSVQKFFRRNVITYSAQPTSGSTFTYTNKVYGLIGIHIIHKTQNHPSFVFATWEHVGVENDNMRYVLLNSGNPQADSLGYMVPIRNPILPITDMATQYVHKNLLSPTSVWQNYRLVGVQGTPNSSTSTPNFFLANYVIESDSLLARFHGSGFASPFDQGNNVFYKNGLYSVGGCQGCHGGGAQHGGTDFSFIVRSRNDAPDPVAGMPVSATAKKVKDTKLERLKKMYK